MIRSKISYGDHGSLLQRIPILHPLFQAAASRFKLSIPSDAQLLHPTIQAALFSRYPSVRAATCWVAVDNRSCCSRLPPLVRATTLSFKAFTSKVQKSPLKVTFLIAAQVFFPTR
ncbi:hypothetical protein S83_044243 [Arachis hypogaea]